MSQARFVDPGKEHAVLGFIASACFEVIPEASLIPAAAFYDESSRVIYRAACSLRQAGKPVIIDTVNAVIEQSRHQGVIQKGMEANGSVLSWEQWWCSDMVDCSLVNSGERIITWTLSELYVLHRRRQLVHLGERLATGDVEPEEAGRMFADFMPNGNGALPGIVSAYDLCMDEKIVEPVQVINGLLHQGSKMTIGGASKSFKTWTMLQLAICIAAGREWLGFETCGKPVVYVNFELPEFAIARRISSICEAIGIGYPKNLAVMNLRGYACSTAIILPKLEKAIKDNGYVSTFLDPIYKLMGERDENSARDIGQVLNDVERFSVSTSNSVIYGQHFSKGNQAAKEAMDRISGSGVFARDPDTIVTMTRHAEDDCFIMDMVLRNLPAQDPLVVKRCHPLMVRADELDPEDIKQPKKPNAKKFTEEDLLSAMDFFSPIPSVDQVFEKVIQKKPLSRRTFDTLWKKCKEAKQVEEIKEGWIKK